MPKPIAVGSPEFRIFETAEFSRRLEGLPEVDRKAVRKKLDGFVYPQIQGVPFFGPNIKKLRGYTPDTWRYRVGRIRVFYTVDQAEHVVYMLTVEWRKDAYR